MDEKLIEQIQEKFKAITELGYNYQYMDLKRLAEEILGLLNESSSSTEDPEKKRDYDWYRQALRHTIKKEVDDAENAFSKAMKPNAAKVRKQEFRVKLRAAVAQIKQDLYSILNT